MSPAEFLLVDISNTFTKFALADADKVRRVHRLPTAELTATRFASEISKWKFARCVLASVVPDKSAAIRAATRGDVVEVSSKIPLGVGIRYPRPESIGADRLANAAAAFALFPMPAIIVDFGTAVTFDVVSDDGFYIGGVIAPGIISLTDYLHRHTALLPKVKLRKPACVVGKSTREAMISGAVFGYRGLIREILAEVTREQFGQQKPTIIATGGDAVQLSKLLPLFDAVLPGLTLEGLRRIGLKNPQARCEKTRQIKRIAPKHSPDEEMHRAEPRA
jgi:type III pantothenate kinase